MILYKSTRPLQQRLQELRSNKCSVGFVPTMGALHKGHLSLIHEAKKHCDIVVCSVFVNPTQFNDKKDFEKYPVTIENDIYLLEESKTDMLFLPSVNEIYPQGISELQHFNLGYLENILEGKFRPGHFQGVCNVVYRLLEIVKPGTLFLGRKDYQQYLVLKKMVQQFFTSTNIIAVDTARETSGLAMSSRNMRLSEEGRNKAIAINQSLQYIKQNIGKHDLISLKEKAKAIILESGFERIDYVEICDAATLLPADENKHDNMIALVAAYIEDVRLIDNIII